MLVKMLELTTPAIFQFPDSDTSMVVTDTQLCWWQIQNVVKQGPCRLEYGSIIVERFIHGAWIE